MAGSSEPYQPSGLNGADLTCFRGFRLRCLSCCQLLLCLRRWGSLLGNSCLRLLGSTLRSGGLKRLLVGLPLLLRCLRHRTRLRGLLLLNHYLSARSLSSGLKTRTSMRPSQMWESGPEAKQSPYLSVYFQRVF